MGYFFLNVEIRWSASALLTYFTPKLSTTSIKVVFRVVWVHNPHVNGHDLYPSFTSTACNPTLASFPLTKYPTVWYYFFFKVVVVDDFLWYHLDVEFCILKILQVCV